MKHRKNLLVLGVLIVIFIIGMYPLLKSKVLFPGTPSKNSTNPGSSVCNKIGTPEMKSFCLAEISEDKSYCEKLDGPDQKVCLASVTKNSSYCKELSSQEKQNCYQNLVIVASSPKFCDQLGNAEMISTCYVHFVSQNFFASRNHLLNSSLCDKVLADSPEKRFCMAMTTGDISYCTYAQNECSVIKDKNPERCLSSASSTDREECYHALAMLNKDETLCASIQNTDMKDFCYLDFGNIGADTSACDKITNEMKKWQCYKNVAVNLQKESEKKL